MDKNKAAKVLSVLTSRLSISHQLKNIILAEKYGLNQAEFRCLNMIGLDKGLSNRELARRMHLSESRMTRIIDGLVDKRFISRKRDKREKKFVRLSLTDKGRRFNKNVIRKNVAAHKMILQDLKRTEQKLILKGMNNLDSASERWVNKPIKTLKSS